MPAPWAGPILAGPPRRVPWAGAVDHAARLDRARPPWACYALRGPGLIFRGRWSWSESAGTARPDHMERPRPVAGAAPPGLPPNAARPALPRPAPGRGAPEGRRGAAPFRPPRFPPRFPAGISPVTRAAGDSPAHNAGPRRSPRNASSINHRNMKSTNFMQVRLHKTVVFCNILLFFAKT